MWVNLSLTCYLVDSVNARSDDVQRQRTNVKHDIRLHTVLRYQRITIPLEYMHGYIIIVKKHSLC